MPDSQIRIGHVHLKVAHLQRALAFYCGVLGLEVTQRLGVGTGVGLVPEVDHLLGGSPPPPGSTGLYHFAIVYPTRAALADALRRLITAGIPLEARAITA